MPACQPEWSGFQDWENCPSASLELNQTELGVWKAERDLLISVSLSGRRLFGYGGLINSVGYHNIHTWHWTRRGCWLFDIQFNGAMWGRHCIPMMQLCIVNGGVLVEHVEVRCICFEQNKCSCPLGELYHVDWIPTVGGATVSAGWNDITLYQRSRILFVFRRKLVEETGFVFITIVHRTEEEYSIEHLELAESASNAEDGPLLSLINSQINRGICAPFSTE